MKVIAFNGSARKDGNTAILIKRVFEELNKEEINTELIQLAGQKVQGCIACRKCFSVKNKKCAITEDIINDCIAKMVEADGIILGSPTYFADCTISATRTGPGSSSLGLTRACPSCSSRCRRCRARQGRVLRPLIRQSCNRCRYRRRRGCRKRR